MHLGWLLLLKAMPAMLEVTNEAACQQALASEWIGICGDLVGKALHALKSLVQK